MPFDPHTATLDFNPNTAAPDVPTPDADPPTIAPVADQGLGFEKGLKLPLDNAAAGLEALVRKTGLPVDDINAWWNHLTGQAPATSAGSIRHDDIQRWNDAAKPGPNGQPGRKPGMFGQIAGGLISGIPLVAATRNPWLVGAGTGLLNTESDALGVIATDTALGAVFGKAGDAAVNTVGAVVSPIWRKTVRQLLQEGVPLTPGQITGGALHRVEDAAMSFPIIGDMVRGASQRSLDGFNNAAANRALAPLGQVLPKNIAAGHSAVAYTQDAISNAYNSTLGRMNLTYDAPLHTDLKSIITDAQRELPADYYHSFENIIRTRVFDALLRKGQSTAAGSAAPAIGTTVPGAQGFRNGVLSGADLKEVEGALNAEARAFMPKGGFDSKYATFINDLKATLHDALSRQNPNLAPALDAADRGYANLARIEPAAAPAKGGVFTAEGLHAAAVQGDRTVRRRTAASGGALMQDLATAGRDVVSRTIPDSGTATRSLINLGAGALLFDRAPQLALNPWAVGGAAAVMSPYTKLGGKVARTLMTARPQGAPAARQVIEMGGPPATVGAAALALYNHNNARRRQYRSNGTHVEYRDPGDSNWTREQ